MRTRLPTACSSERAESVRIPLPAVEATTEPANYSGKRLELPKKARATGGECPKNVLGTGIDRVRPEALATAGGVARDCEEHLVRCLIQGRQQVKAHVGPTPLFECLEEIARVSSRRCGDIGTHKRL